MQYSKEIVNKHAIACKNAISEFKKGQKELQAYFTRPIRNEGFKVACIALRDYMQGVSMFGIAGFLCNEEDLGNITKETSDTVFYMVRMYRLRERGLVK